MPHGGTRVFLTEELLKGVKQIRDAEGMSFNKTVAMLLRIAITEYHKQKEGKSNA